MVHNNGLKDEQFSYARTCYDHLAGSVGVEITESLVKQGMLEENGKNFSVTAEGDAFFSDLGIDLDGLHQKKRAFARSCLDVTERTPHLAGALGGALLARLIDLEWIKRIPETRTVEVTRKGQTELERLRLISHPLK
ncbi:hypothetical protein [Indiicoccus explosivorum]|uniref:hypothetical protein n=1 Tax=Indiicoccus explosivorum TaxID=1917864 RepID=UPI000B433A54|nr:hypothetical protein [Indiicoccus explosivorum]